MVNRVILGANATGTNGLFISKPGIDVFTANQASLLFDSTLGAFGSVVATGLATAGSNVAFGPLPYIPFAIVTLYANSNGIINTMTFNGPNGGLNGSTQTQTIPAWSISNSTLYITSPTWIVNSVSMAGAYQVKYVIYRCPGS